jgi:hypothetical protein
MTGPTRSVRVGQPLQLTIWVEHPFEPDMWVGWMQYKGPGEVSLGPAEQQLGLENGRGVARVTATFSEPGEYELLVQAIDHPANFEFHCCWTNAYVPVSVTR